MSNVSGAITNVNSETISLPGKRPFTVHSIEVNGMWFEAGYKAPGRIGENVTFSYELKYGKNKITDGTLIKGASAMSGATPYASPKVVSTGPTASGGKAFPVPKNHPDRSIIRQNAVNRAVEVLTATGHYLHFIEDGKRVDDAGLDVLAATTIGLAMRFEAYYAGETETMIAALAEKECVV